MITREIVTGMLILAVSSYLYNKFQTYEKSVKCREDRDAIAKYLLSTNNEYSASKPNLWIHIPDEYNARCWQSWGSRSSTTVNQPFIGLTVGSIINKCSNEFNICAVSDHNISELLPCWHVDLTQIGDPVKSKMRDLAMAKLIFKFGGLIVPCNFVCQRSLRPAYDTAFITTGAIVFPQLNTTAAIRDEIVLSDKFLGCRPNCKVIGELIELLQNIASDDQTEASIFEGRVFKWLNDAREKNLITCISPTKCGVIDENEKVVTVDRLMNDEFIPFSDNCYGIILPRKALLERKTYSWFSVLSAVDSVMVNNCIGKLLLVNL
jgi:hypothetical protein